MAKITFGQITLEDPNKSLQELVQIYKGLFVNDEFGLPLISAVADIEEDEDPEEEYDEPEEVEEEVEKEVEPVIEEPAPAPQPQAPIPTPPQAQFQDQPPQSPGGSNLY
jgi:hypothetical protein